MMRSSSSPSQPLIFSSNFSTSAIDQMRLINKSYKQDLALDEMQRKQRAEFDKSQREETSAFSDATSEYDQ